MIEYASRDLHACFKRPQDFHSFQVLTTALLLFRCPCKISEPLSKGELGGWVGEMKVQLTHEQFV